MIGREGIVPEEHYIASQRFAFQVEETETKTTRLVQEGEKAAGHRCK